VPRRNYGGVRGDHGWDNTEPDMQAIFIASGPDFKPNVTIPPFPNRSVYPLLCHLLNVTASPNNGSLSDFALALQPV
jgi:ectonucleotide pyrophosphatase/phosphodiesterase family member 5